MGADVTSSCELSGKLLFLSLGAGVLKSNHGLLTGWSGKAKRPSAKPGKDGVTRVFQTLSAGWQADDRQSSVRRRSPIRRESFVALLMSFVAYSSSCPSSPASLPCLLSLLVAPGFSRSLELSYSALLCGLP